MDFIHHHAGWLIWPLVIVGVIWFWRGGTEYESSHEPFIEPLAPLNTGATYGDVYLTKDRPKQKLDLPENPITALRNFFGKFGSAVRTEPSAIPFTKVFLIDGAAGAYGVNTQEEYLRIIASQDNATSSVLSGLILTGSGNSIRETIPQAVNMLVLGSTTLAKTDVVMPPRGRAIITTGSSPVGNSFRVNMCTGYLGQFQTYAPELRPDCPAPKDELMKYGPYQDAACRTFVEKLPLCRSYSGDLPAVLSSDCKKFITEKLTYNACVMDHGSDADFLKNEWRIYLGKAGELWENSGEIIRLYDKRGSVIDAITY